MTHRGAVSLRLTVLGAGIPLAPRSTEPGSPVRQPGSPVRNLYSGAATGAGPRPFSASNPFAETKNRWGSAPVVQWGWLVPRSCCPHPIPGPQSRGLDPFRHQTRLLKRKTAGRTRPLSSGVGWFRDRVAPYPIPGPQSRGLDPPQHQTHLLKRKTAGRTRPLSLAFILCCDHVDGKEGLGPGCDRGAGSVNHARVKPTIAPGEQGGCLVQRSWLMLRRV